MNASIHDTNALFAIGTAELGAYLRSSGWQEMRLIADRAAIWQKRNEAGEEFETLVPQKRSLDDYALRMAQVLEALAVVESRSELEIYADILRTQTDTVRLQFRSSLFEDGSVPLDQAVRMVEGAREIALAAACATVSPRAAYSKRKPQQAMEYLGKVRMGQTERGSFVLALHTSVPPRLRVSERSQTALNLELPVSEAEEPFERRVTLTLAHSLKAALNAALRANATGDLTPFHESIAQGVSANLCDALANIGIETPTQSLCIGFQWSPNRALLTPAPSATEFMPDQFSILREAARLFRENEPLEDYEVVGYVVRLDRGEGEIAGQVTISSYIEDRPRKIRLILNDADYQIAVKAHSQECPVQCTGELVKEGHSYTMRNPRNFSLLA